MDAVSFRLALVAVLLGAGCSGNGSTTPTPSTGGSGGNSVGSGGNVGSGGTTATGGSTSTGGSARSGGTSGSGGITGSGGVTSSGGITGSGGNSATGGTSGTGGVSQTGGSAGTGGGATGGTAGTVATGGNAGARTGGAAGGGATGTGGVATGGTNATGGARTGGTMGSGGAATGGMTGGTGGSTGGTSGSTIVGATPPMGWNSWNAFNCGGLNETVVKNMADAFVSTGMKDVGYEYVNLDDCWMVGRDSAGKIKVSASKFPNGMASLANYVHGKGLKFGIYSTPNTKTCAGLYGGYAGGVGSLGHETTDAQTYADWGVDYLKYDKCQGQLSAFAVMRDALKKTGRPIFYSINPADQGPYCTPTNCSIDLISVANMWRIEFDISAKWSEIIRLIDKNKPEYVGAGPGHWNDPDMLEVGNGLNDTEGRAHFSMWAIMAAPLITGNDLTKMSQATKTTLTNAEVIAVDQDPLGYQGRVVAGNGTNQEVWSKNLTGTNTRAVALFNRGTSSANITVQWSQLGIPTGAATVRNLWSGQDLGSFTGSYTANNVASHDVVMLKVVSTP
jgi:alpha-galactosidase